jgi:hypothetical protein
MIKSLNLDIMLNHMFYLIFIIQIQLVLYDAIINFYNTLATML